jgi:hypothetical protein
LLKAPVSVRYLRGEGEEKRMEAVADSRTLRDELIPGVDQELQVRCEMGLLEPGKPWLTQGDTSDRDRIGWIVLAAAPARPTADGGQMGRNIDHFLTPREESAREGQAEAFGPFDGHAALTTKVPDPGDEPLKLSRICPDFERRQRPALLVDCPGGVRPGVGVDPDDDHHCLLRSWIRWMASDSPAVESSRRYEVTRPSAWAEGTCPNKVKAGWLDRKIPGHPRPLGNDATSIAVPIAVGVKENTQERSRRPRSGA